MWLNPFQLLFSVAEWLKRSSLSIWNRKNRSILVNKHDQGWEGELVRLQSESSVAN